MQSAFFGLLPRHFLMLAVFAALIVVGVGILPKHIIVVYNFQALMMQISILLGELSKLLAFLFSCCDLLLVLLLFSLHFVVD